jgi:hypothetical protein
MCVSNVIFEEFHRKMRYIHFDDFEKNDFKILYFISKGNPFEIRMVFLSRNKTTGLFIMKFCSKIILTQCKGMVCTSQNVDFGGYHIFTLVNFFRFASCGWDKRLNIWDVETGAILVSVLSMCYHNNDAFC